MRVAVTGATGLVGRFVVQALLSRGDAVVALGRRQSQPGFFGGATGFLPFDLDAPPPELSGVDALIHCAFAHVPGRYRGGEGDDPDGFRRRNLDGSLRLFRAARSAGVARVVFLSSRAVYDGLPPDVALTEEASLDPDSLYGRVKLGAEQALAALSGDGFATVSLRATGVYGPAGPGQAHKWADLFRDFLAGRPVAPRAGTEVHGQDLAAAVVLLLAADLPPAAAFNASDLVLDRRDLLAEVVRLTGSAAHLPPRADPGGVRAMDCSRLRALGWRPGGMARLRASLPEMLAQSD